MTPWWARPAVRLPLLLALLAGVAWYGIQRLRTPDIPRRQSAGCTSPPLPAPIRLTPAALAAAVQASGIEWLPGHRALYAQGPQDPLDAWWDDLPIRDPGRPRRLDAGYQFDWWADRTDYQIATLFVFASASAARQWVHRASSTQCRANAVGFAESSPAGARLVVWNNYRRYLQSDLYFAIANRGYRLAEINADRPPPSAAQVGERAAAWPEQLACELLVPDCRN